MFDILDGQHLTDNPERDRWPTWSPDGTRIAFESYRDDNWDIYVMNADGSGQTRLTDDPAREFAPAWSPDGARIAFDSNRHGNFEVYVMNADGSEQSRLTVSQPNLSQRSAWSPDGTRIAFPSSRGGRRGETIDVINADGGGLTNLTDNPANDSGPAWTPWVPGRRARLGMVGSAWIFQDSLDCLRKWLER